MAVALTQVITEDRASGAQVIDGSLKFVSGNTNYLNRTPGSAGNRRTWTWSAWFKRTDVSASTGNFTLFAAQQPSGSDQDGLIVDADGSFYILFYSSDPGGGNLFYYRSDMQLRDPSAWYHVLFVLDTTQSTVDDRCNVYINGERVVDVNTSNRSTLSQNFEAAINNTGSHTMGKSVHTSDPGDGHLSQVYFIDGYALSPSDFGFTDGLTNTWRPKKYTGTYGTNGFYLPMDGNSPIGEDKSGNGNNFTPAGFGGSNTIEKATGALPILNTVNGGNVAVPGVFGSKVSKTLTTNASTNTSNGFVFANEGTKPTLSFVRGATYTFDYSASTAHPLRFATAADAAGSTEYTDGTDTSVANTVKITVPHNAPDTLYYYCTNHGGMGNSISVTTDEKVADPYAWKNILALPLVGSAADESNKLNVGSTTKTITVSGSTATFAYSNFYGGSYDFDGSNYYLAHSATNSGPFFLQGDFTVEGWARIESGQTNDRYIFSLNAGVLADSSTSWHLRINSSKFEGVMINGSTQYKTISANNYTPNKWQHVAYVREGNQQRLYVDGILSATTSHTPTPNVNNSSTLFIGALRNGYNFINAQLQDLRIYNGVAKYTSNFIPASTDPDILPDTPSGVAGGSALTKITDGAVAFDGSGDYLRIAATSDFDQSPGTDFTAEAYIYMTAASGPSHIMGFQVDGNNRCSWYFTDSTTTLNWYTNLSGSGSNKISTPSNYVSLNAWHHVAVTRSGSTTYLFVDGILQGTSTTTDYPSGNQLLDIGTYNASGYNPDSFPGFISNVRYIKGTALYTSNFTPPTRTLTNVTNTKLLCCQSTTSPTLSAVAPDSSQTITANGNVSAATDNPFSSVTDGSASFDGSGDYLSIADSADFELGSGNFTIEFYVNSTQAHAASYISAVSKWQSSNFSWMVRYSSADIGTGWSFFWSTTGSNYSTVFGQAINDGEWHHIAVTRSGTTIRTFTDGVLNNSTTTSDTFYNGNADVVVGSDQGGNYFNGFISNLRILKGTALYTSNFTAPTSTLVAVPDTVLLTCTSRTTVTDNEKYATVRNGNVAATNFNPFTTDIDAVRGQESGYCTWNPLKLASGTITTLSNGNLNMSSGNDWDSVFGTIGVSSGKWYWESMPSSSTYMYSGIANDNHPASSYPSQTSNSWAYLTSNGVAYYNQDGGGGSVTLSSMGAGDTLGIALDMDSGKIWFSKNGVWMQGDPYIGTNAVFSNLTLGTTYFPCQDVYGASATTNFGQKPFKYAPPEGFKTLCLANLPRPTKAAVRPDKYFNTVLYTGNNGTNAITGVGFQPDLVWIKNRTNANNNMLFDSIRGTDNALISNTTAAESASVDGTLSAFGSDGFTAYWDGAAGTGGNTNQSSNNYVAWCWKAGGAAVSNTDGSITSQVSANQDAGFSIVSYTGTGANATVGHGLSAAPKMIIVKDRDASVVWAVHHSDISINNYLRLNTTDSQVAGLAVWNQTAPTSTVFSIGSSTIANNTNDYIAYCWSEVPGFSKFGKYTGNASDDGPFVYCGFRPRWILTKSSTLSSIDSNWRITDTARSTYNVSDDLVWANLSTDELANANGFDICSNGFKIRTASNEVNSSGQTYIFAAFAEAPTQNLFGGQANAR